jgi:TorA maturation chaperone TorD
MVAAWSALKAAAGKASMDGAAAVDEEYQELFIGLGRGELAPYGSWYITGFLMEKPLGKLRQDLAALGYERPPGVHEPEDHVAALCEVMAMLITDDTVPFAVQRTFFETHLGSWMERFFSDLENARSACFYRSVGCLGQAFIGLEKHYFAMLV